MPSERGQYNPPSQDQLISKLHWLNGRAQPDFKGHVPQAETRLTASIVKERKEAIAKKRCGADDFLPFRNASNKYINMRFDATKPGVNPAAKLREHHDENGQLVGQSKVPYTHPTQNAYRQELDPVTGRPYLNTVLTYNEDQFIPQQRPSGRRTFADRNASNIFLRSESCNAAGTRPTYGDVHGSSSNQRLDVLRADMMRHPMFTAESKISHATSHWDPMTQLLGHQYMSSPPRKERPALQQKRNPIRMVEVMRRSNSAKPWH